MSEHSIQDIVMMQDAEKTRTIAKVLRVGRSLTRKAELAGAITNLVKTDIQAVLKHCSIKEKQVLALATYKKGCISAKMFSSLYGYGFPERVTNYGSRNVSPYQALVFGDDYRNSNLKISDELIEILKNVFTQPATEVVKTVDEIPSEYDDRTIHIHLGETTIFNELKNVLRLVHQEKISVSEKTRKPPAAAVKAITKALVAPDFHLEDPYATSNPYSEPAGPVRAYAWGILVQSCGWGTYSNGKLKLSSSGKKVMNGDFKEFISGVWSYLKSSKFDELRRVKTIRGQSGKGKRGLSDTKHRKPELLAAIQKWPVNEWLSFEEVCRFQLASKNSFTVSGDLWNLYFSEKSYGNLAYDGGGGELEKVYTRVFLFEYMATLGLIDVAYVYPHYLWPEFNGWWGSDEHAFCSRYDGLLYVRLNPLGAYCFKISDSYNPPEPVKHKFFLIQANLDIVVTSPPGAVELHYLEMIARQISEKVWKTDKETILTSIEKGISLKELRDFAAAYSQNKLPETLVLFLNDIEKKINSIESLSDAVVVKCRDSVTAATLANDSSLMKYCTLSGESSIVYKKKNEKAFTTQLKKKGYILPK